MDVLLERALAGSGCVWRTIGKEHLRTASVTTTELQYGGELSKSMTTSMALTLGNHILR